MSSRYLAVLVALGSLWGASFLFIKVVVDETAPIELAAGRIVFGAVALAPVVWMRGLRLSRRPWLLADLLVLAVFASAVPFILISWAELHIDTGIASVLNSTSLAVEGAPALDLSTKAWLAWLTLGALNTGVAGVVYYWLIKHVGSVRTSLVTYIIPTVGLLLGAVVLDEELGLNALLGAALIVAGVAMGAGGFRLALGGLVRPP